MLVSIVTVSIYIPTNNAGGFAFLCILSDTLLCCILRLSFLLVSLVHLSLGPLQTGAVLCSSHTPRAPLL